MYKTILGNQTWVFRDLKELMAKASLLRSGDLLAGIAAGSAEETAAARICLAEVPLKSFLTKQMIPYDDDEVTRLIVDTHDAAAFSPIAHMCVGDFRNWLLSYHATPARLARLGSGLTPEMVAAVSKLMQNQDLILVASKIKVVKKFRSTVGLAGTMATRLQPNHPTDDPQGILASILEGLTYGCGDAVIGINPASDSPAAAAQIIHMLDELIHRFEIPTQSCVLTHATTSIRLIEKDVPVDLVFQSVAGTQAANESFGISLSILREAYEAGQSLRRGTIGKDVMYFETGQGSCLSANAHHGVDQQTCEARAYAVCRPFSPLLVNTVVGFIGPEYLYDGKQIIRAGLEDHFCGKLLGLPMGCDICYTNHAEADQNDMDVLLTLLGTAGNNFIIAVPGADDIMLNYQSTSYHDQLYVRDLLGLKRAPEFAEWLRKMNLADDEGRITPIESDNPLMAAHLSLAS
ncbi:ethanolamine ammonia-lyase subunit EutB [Agrobacterium vitis]|uniref:Ethanolamine ammonia-lyase large subunit n=1 Tax=Agrobacterium vitis TaxID=373 RepID=A0A1S2E430_AGRVI|nr:ethanolamine ammonia-lyase subunit EutB [Agrobacterium vitis]MUO80882.1 ethanolamine ammonia-lyase subunit EutB [Agrobacterium vitis]MUO94790.1 ethanolamine ammonia-lyase subunit EutB [Agrobacterium vitis]MUP05448.1 ethanolamine ammonia-lyase subunit EutB [Agrobacterium vitis]MUZ75750.1 ethanolamine ammonia-lyase subunit EutB [Agrobacterium vitis]MUZ81558.1 ethanolamine ammonia-lyase subunit EutB [Agrobacterium vitis]